jgi:hypothetical protein
MLEVFRVMDVLGLNEVLDIIDHLILSKGAFHNCFFLLSKATV